MANADGMKRGKYKSFSSDANSAAAEIFSRQRRIADETGPAFPQAVSLLPRSNAHSLLDAIRCFFKDNPAWE